MKNIKKFKLLPFSLAFMGLGLIPNSASADVQHLDDVIITFSLCVGNDCNNGESFGFDTIRLKENNLRLHFDDTSTSASFPRNDWRFVANDSSNGGDSYMAIEDSTAGRQVFRVDAGAPANSLRVDSAGDVGIGTSNPVVDIHNVSGNTPTMRLEQNGSSGFTSQTWDLAGNEANFFIRDVTNSSKLVFRIEPNAPSNAFYIDSTGNIGIRTASPVDDLHIVDSADARLKLTNSSITEDATNVNDWIFNSNGTLRISGGSDGAEFELDASGNLDIAGNIHADGDITSTGTTVVPDYVFEPDYELMPLDEVRKHIAKKRHLPNIPSAKEIKKKGSINVSKMQMRLLKKVEELTLYTLDQDRTIKSLEERLNKLEK